MKKSYILAALLLSSTAAFSEDGTISTFNLALTVSTEGPGTVVKNATTGKPVKDEETNQTTPTYSTTYVVTKGSGDNATATQTIEEASKIVTSKYGTKELLADLADFDVIPEVKNWTIKKIQYAEDGVEDLSEPYFFAVNKDGSIRSLQGIISSNGQLKLSGLNKKTVTSNFENDGESTKVTYSEALKFVGGFGISFDGKQVQTSGVLTTSQKLGFTKGPEKRQVVVSGASKFSSLSGVLSEEGTPSIVEGSASLSAGAIADVSDFVDIIED